MDNKRYYINMAVFLGCPVVWGLLDYIMESDSNFTNALICGFFIAWNIDRCRK